MEELHRPPCAILHIDQHLSLWRLWGQREQWWCLSSRLMAVEEGGSGVRSTYTDRWASGVPQELDGGVLGQWKGFTVFRLECKMMPGETMRQRRRRCRTRTSQIRRWVFGRHCPGEEQRIFSTCVLQLQDTMGIPSLWQLKELHRRRALSAIRDRGALSAIRDRGALSAIRDQGALSARRPIGGGAIGDDQRCFVREIGS